MAEIDELSIGIETQAKDALAAMDSLIQKLDLVANGISAIKTSKGLEKFAEKATDIGKALANFDGSKLAGVADGINKASGAMQNFSANTKTADFSRLARNLASISEIKTENFSDTASKIGEIATAFNSFSKAPEAAQQIGDFAKNIAKLGNKSVQTAIDNIPKLATAMKGLMQTLSTAPRSARTLST